tara:strand:+ start:35 stop:220 length:186 start_codon:yes stop_codon:yes gene_type:complete
VLKNINRDYMKKRATKIPYEGYTLPPSAEKGGRFIDFNKIITPIKKVKLKRKRNERERKRA